MLQLPPMVVARLDEAAGGPEKRSRFVRLVLERRLAAHSNGEGRADVQVNIRIGAKELGRTQRAATAAGMTRTEWIVALIRSHHFATPQFSRADRIALMEAHRELHRIGALLRSLAAGDAEAQILAAVAEIEDQVRALRCAVQGNFEYWRVGP